MILTDKAKELFYEWLGKMHRPTWVMMFEGKSQITQNAYFIEWLDSVGVYICVYPRKGNKIVVFDVCINYELHSVWSTRQEATTEAIKKANEIINLNQ
jgi:hypothetical protein